MISIVVAILLILGLVTLVVVEVEVHAWPAEKVGRLCLQFILA